MVKFNNNSVLYFIVLVMPLVFLSCRKNDIYTTNPVTLKFSTDTIFFDTIFSRLDTFSTGIPRSITLQVRVTNPGNEAVKTNISVEGNTFGMFKLNVDGRSGTNFNDIDILPNDSIYIFVQAYINKGNTNLPFIVTDKLLFNTNGNIQDVKLVAWAQDAHYYKNQVLDCSSGTLFWGADKPHVVYDSILIPKGCTLTIDAGAKVHSFINSAILVQGTLIVNGTADNPVVFEGSRLDDDYKELAGQWIGIRFLPGSVGNKITGAVIKNGYIGIEVDSLPANSSPNLEIEQCRIFDMSAVGLLSYSASVNATNNLIFNCGLFTFVGELGGVYHLKHNTFVMSAFTAGRKDPGFYLSNTPYKDINGNIYKIPLAYKLENNIVTGPVDDEIFVNISADGLPVLIKTVDNNLLKSTNGSYNNSGNILNRDPLFKDVLKNDYDLSGNSVCKNAGKNIGVFKDLKNRNRNTLSPSIGAFEAQ